VKVQLLNRLLLALAIAPPAIAGTLTAEAPGPWPRWRGPLDNGTVTQGNYPVSASATNVLWKAPLPGIGCSTPIIAGRQIVLTAPADGLDAALAFDWSGKQLWQRTFGPEQPGKHRSGSGCNPSPATDGQTLFVYFKSGTLAALQLDGRVRWQTNLVTGFGPVHLYWDQGTSPVLTEKAVIITRMHHGESWVAAFAKDTGRLCWKVSRNYETPVEGDESYTTPLVFRQQGAEAVLVWGAEHMTAYDSAQGQILWSCGGFNPRSMGNWPTVASPIVAGNVVVAAGGRADRGQPRLFGIRLDGKGDVTATNIIWKREDVGTFVPTPAEYKGRLYVLRDQGELQCLDPATGQTLWQASFPKGNAKYYASPTIAAGQLYAAREDGVVFVAQIQDGLKVLAENNLGERVIASPVPVANRILIRGEKHLICIGAD
jgi:outer membrane protein assembly factor BamB